MAIHMSHRFGAAIITSLFILLIAVMVFETANRKLRPLAIVLTIALAIQIALGIMNVYYMLPLTIAVMHNGGALILLLCTIITCAMSIHKPEPMPHE